MYTASLPEYAAPPSQLFSPSYTAIPRTHEYRLAHNPHLRPDRPPRSFVKQTKSGNVSLRLVGQDDRVSLPTYGLAASVQGTVEIGKTEGITSVEVQVSLSLLGSVRNLDDAFQVEGTLKLEEVGEGGTSTHRLFSNKSMLWVKDRIQDVPCPDSLQFRFSLPTSYLDGDKTYVRVQVGFRVT